MEDVKGKVAVITGAGRGTGKGIAIAYGRAGIKTVVTSRTKATVDAVVAQINSEGGTAHGIACDVTDRAQVFAMIDQAAKHFGTVDILVNTAQAWGTAKKPTAFITLRPLHECDEDEWDNIYRSGLLGTMWAMKAAFPYLSKRGGKVINFGSAGGQFGRAGQAAYNATKEGVRALSRTAAREWGPYKINVNVINPMTASDATVEWEKSDPAAVKAVCDQTPLGRFGDVIKDAGDVALFLASKYSDYLTGMTFMLDGGFFMAP
jgi:NAD(P)-dependent dehydrogenase (short-subunit alcohol dehydrogenase family)